MFGCEARAGCPSSSSTEIEDQGNELDNGADTAAEEEKEEEEEDDAGP